MGEIIPRWEWRHFAKEIKLDIDLSKYEKTRHVESTEMYIPSTVVDENPKFRDNKMDVKSLQRVDRDGLEQWKPVIKVEFPLPVSEMEKVLKSTDFQCLLLNLILFLLKNFLQKQKTIQDLYLLK